MPTKKSPTPDASLAAQEKALLTRIERSKLEIAEVEAELANFLAQRKQLDAEINETGATVKRSQLIYSRDAVMDEAEGCKILISEARANLIEAQGQLDAIKAQQAMQPRLAAQVATVSRAWRELLMATDELLAGLADAESQGLRVPILGLAPGGGAALATQRLDLLPRSVPMLSIDPDGSIRCVHTSVATADLSAEVAA